MASLSTQTRSHSATYTTTNKNKNKRHPNSLPSRSTSFQQQQPSSSNCKPHSTNSHHQLPRTPSSSGQTNPNYLLVDQINRHQDLYLVLGLSGYSALNRQSIKLDDIRKAYISRSRLCHPDKLPQYEPCTAAFQKLSFAYETLSNPHTRKLYDSNHNRSPHAFNFDNSSSSSSSRSRNSNSNTYNGGGSNKSNPNPKTDAHTHSSSYSSSTTGQNINPDETLNGVLHATFCEFMDGDFEMIRVVINALNEGNPGLNLGEEMIESLEKTFTRLRRVLLSGQKYLGVVRYEMLELWELQAKLRGMSYFNLVGRMRVSLALARVTLLIPMRIDQALRDGSLSSSRVYSSSQEDNLGQEEQDSSPASEMDLDQLPHPPLNHPPRNGILPPKIAGLLQATVAVLERGERATLWPYSSPSAEPSVHPSSPSPSSSSSSSSESSSSTTTTTTSPTTTTATLPVSPSPFDPSSITSSSSSSAASSPSSPAPSSSDSSSSADSSSSSNTSTATTSPQIPVLPPVHILPSLVHTPPNPPPAN
ncbi:hypothetical protein PGTUg99_034110 [Puccinia graminis f. sp. tritici]|uniref:J domain-containing protein n=1 Tax=Puccinia graminis f. sp. tritici TaxID=56615 RepID=A0A5B0MG56_PUCGR|nr:hypothetical protein PGTUg99_034110 [Puccinia graminis f. sp. tritici]